jgi:thiol-disulfide isomerase/thioredoxin
MAHPVRDFLLRRRLFLAGGLAFLALPALADVGPALLKGAVAKFELAKAPKPLPDLEFLDADDKPVTFAGFKGKVVLINFWATWCAPCVKEMPSLDRLQAAMGKEKFVVLPLSLDGPSKPKVVPFYKDRNLANLGIYFDKGRKAMQKLDISILPTSILVDPAGRELGRLEGEADWDKPEAIALMKAAAGGAS